MFVILSLPWLGQNESCRTMLNHFLHHFGGMDPIIHNNSLLMASSSYILSTPKNLSTVCRQVLWCAEYICKNRRVRGIILLHQSFTVTSTEGLFISCTNLVAKSKRIDLELQIL